MEAKYFIDSNNNYVGAFVGAEPPAGSIEVPFPPESAFDVWNGSGWTPGQRPLTLAERLDASFMTLPVSVRAQFYPLKASVKLALEQNDIDVAIAIIQSAQVPPELQGAKDGLLNLFGDS